MTPGEYREIQKKRISMDGQFMGSYLMTLVSNPNYLLINTGNYVK